MYFIALISFSYSILNLCHLAIFQLEVLVDFQNAMALYVSPLYMCTSSENVGL